MATLLLIFKSCYLVVWLFTLLDHIIPILWRQYCFWYLRILILITVFVPWNVFFGAMHCCLSRISFCFVFLLVWSVSHRRFPSNLGMGGDLFTHGRCAKDVMSNSVCMGGAFDWSTLLEGDQVAIQLFLWRNLQMSVTTGLSSKAVLFPQRRVLQSSSWDREFWMSLTGSLHSVHRL